MADDGALYCARFRYGPTCSSRQSTTPADCTSLRESLCITVISWSSSVYYQPPYWTQNTRAFVYDASETLKNISDLPGARKLRKWTEKCRNYSNPMTTTSSMSSPAQSKWYTTRAKCLDKEIRWATLNQSYLKKKCIKTPPLRRKWGCVSRCSEWLQRYKLLQTSLKPFVYVSAFISNDR